MPYCIYSQKVEEVDETANVRYSLDNDYVQIFYNNVWNDWMKAGLQRKYLFTANNDSSEFALQMKIPDNSQVITMVNGELQQATYNANTQKIKFNKTITKDSECSVEYYFAGAFNGDFSAISGDSSVSRNIEQKVKNILARLLVIAWSESVRDMLVDIQGILRDTDFKLTPNSQILNAKVNWVRSLQEKNQAEQTQLAWIVRFSKNKGKFSR